MKTELTSLTFVLSVAEEGDVQTVEGLIMNCVTPSKIQEIQPLKTKRFVKSQFQIQKYL